MDVQNMSANMILILFLTFGLIVFYLLFQCPIMMHYYEYKVNQAGEDIERQLCLDSQEDKCVQMIAEHNDFVDKYNALKCTEADLENIG